VKPKVTVYVSAEELAELKKEAARRRVSVSRYAKERLDFAQDKAKADAVIVNGDGLSAAAEQRLADGIRKALAARADDLADNLRTVMVMLDQLVRSTLTHLPEIPAAQHKERFAAGERRHREWQGQVADLLRQMRSEAAKEKAIAAGNGNGAHA
jgi:hypothetical protein